MSDNNGPACNAAGDSCAAAAAAPALVPRNLLQNENINSPIDSSLATEGQKPDEVEKPALTQKEEPNNNEQNEASKLKQQVQERTQERDDYQKKLLDSETKLAALQASYNAVTNGGGDEITLRREIEDLKNTLAQTQLKLEDRGRLIANQDTQIKALSKQVSSLKEVIAITKDLLNIRNMEVKHLQNDVDSMESRISTERERHNTMLGKMDAAVRLNADLKKEYETQLRLFQDLRGKYEQKVTLLSEENRVLEAAATHPVAQ